MNLLLSSLELHFMSLSFWEYSFAIFFFVMRLYVKKPMFPLLSGVPFSKAI